MSTKKGREVLEKLKAEGVICVADWDMERKYLSFIMTDARDGLQGWQHQVRSICDALHARRAIKNALSGLTDKAHTTHNANYAQGIITDEYFNTKKQQK